MKGVVLKIDLSKDFDKVSWLYLRLLMTHLGFEYLFISCITSTSFAVLINRSASPFFKAKRGLHQGCPLSPFLFLSVVDSLSKAILDTIVGLRISNLLNITHLLFIDDILLICDGSKRDTKKLAKILKLFEKAR